MFVGSGTKRAREKSGGLVGLGGATALAVSVSLINCAATATYAHSSSSLERGVARAASRMPGGNRRKLRRVSGGHSKRPNSERNAGGDRISDVVAGP